MKKAYRKAEAYKVSFNANEQVAAACNSTADMITTKYPLGGDMNNLACTEEGGKYGVGAGICFVNGNGFFDGSAFGWGTFQYEVQYA